MARKKTASTPTRAELAAVRKHFGWMLAPLRGLRKNPWSLLNQPTTYMGRVRSNVQKQIEKRVREVGQGQFVRELAGVGIPRRVLVEGFARAADHLREEEQAIAKLPGGRGLLGLVGAADARVRNSPLMLFMNLKFVLGVSAIAPAGQFHRALRERGEQRARQLLHVIAAVSEGLYRPYLVEVWNLTEFAGDPPRVPQKPQSFGRLVGDLEKRLKGVKGIVEPLALRVRNAVDHDRFEYVASRKSFILRNKDGWRGEVSVDKLKALAEELFTVAGTTFPRTLHWFVQSAFLRSGLFSAFLRLPPAFERNDEAELQRIGLEMQSRTQAMYGELARLFAASQGGGEHLREVAEQSRVWMSGPTKEPQDGPTSAVTPGPLAAKAQAIRARRAK